MVSQRNNRIDLLKGFSIIAVILYHLGVMEYGYLGVDVFFVTGGYLFYKSMHRENEKGDISFFRSILKKLVRLVPLVLIVSAVSLILGYFMMLPDDYENLSESAIATTFFSNNILACITTKNYWDVANIFKPLMHTWYVGVLLEEYILMTAVYVASVKIFKKKQDSALKIIFVIATAVSLLLFLLPVFSTAQKFYYLPFRLFEFTAGSLLAVFPGLKNKLSGYTKASVPVSLALYLLLLFIIIKGVPSIPSSILLISVVLITFILLALPEITNEKVIKCLTPVLFLGKSSYSFYLWHQVIVAFMYYSFVKKLSVASFLIFCLITVAVSVLSYYFIEQKILSFDKKGKRKIIITCSVILAVIICGCSALLYNKAGVVRDVPELGIVKGEANRGIHSQYCDRPYKWNKDFEDNSKVHVLVFGNSFGRDFANILYESEFSDKLEISYIFVDKNSDESSLTEYRTRIDSADYVFFAMHTSYEDVPGYLLKAVPSQKLYVIGDKSFGASNGIFYSKRNSSDYFNQSAEIDEALIKKNNNMKIRYGTHYIDMITSVNAGENKIKVFTDDGHFISQDCRHLTKFGAIYYAKILDLSWIAERE